MTTSPRVPVLHAGDKLTRDEFERRYAAMPDLKKAELIEGVVYMGSPVSLLRHGQPHAVLWSWPCNYWEETPGLIAGDNSTLRLDLDNEPQPDLLLCLPATVGGRSRITPDGYLEGPPELVIEVAASSVSYDLHQKLDAYRRNGVQECATTPLYVSSTTRVEPASTNACIGSNGVRPMLGYAQGEAPVFGSTFITRVERTLPSSFAIGIVGLSRTMSGSIPLPALIGYGGLDSQGNPSPCYVRVDPLVTIAVFTDASGAGEYSMNFAWSPAILGTKVYQQALCFDPSLNALGLSVSNDASYVLGDRPF